MTDRTEQAATLFLKLKADNGYTSEGTHRVSADQYAAITAIAYGTIDAVAAMKLITSPEVG